MEGKEGKMYRGRIWKATQSCDTEANVVSSQVERILSFANRCPFLRASPLASFAGRWRPTEFRFKFYPWAMWRERGYLWASTGLELVQFWPQQLQDPEWAAHFSLISPILRMGKFKQGICESCRQETLWTGKTVLQVLEDSSQYTVPH